MSNLCMTLRFRAPVLALLFFTAPFAASQNIEFLPPVPASNEASAVAQRKELMKALGLEHPTARDLYQGLLEMAGGETRLSWTNLPDWSGIWRRTGGIRFESETPQGQMPTVQLTPEYEQRLIERIENRRQGIEFDPLSLCEPPGYPRWYTETFLRDWIVTPDQTWMTSEYANETRRVYTDGRSHLPEEARYPTYDGDSIGFWAGDRLVIHTNQLKSGIYTRGYPDYSEQVETVEVIQKIGPTEIHADVWVYDPPVLLEPWHVTARFEKLEDPEKLLRIHYWHCTENPNNSTFMTEEGSTDHRQFTFEDDQ